MSPTKALVGMTPYEKLTGTKPDVSNLHVCGCVAFAHVPKKKRASKLSPKAKPTLFLGYAQTSLGYRLLDLRTGDLIEQRDVSFREDITVDSTYVERLLARRYEGSDEELPVRVPYVRLPVNAVLDTVHIPTRPSDEDSEDDDMASVDGDSTVTTRKRRRKDSSDSSNESSDDVDFSGSFEVDNDTGNSGSSVASASRAGGSATSSSPASGSPTSGASFANSDDSDAASASSTTVNSATAPSPPAARRIRGGTTVAQPLPQPTRRSTRVQRPNSRYDPSTWVMTCTLMACMLIGVVSEWLNPMTVRQTLASEHAWEWRAAMDAEYESLMKNLTWELVPRPKSTKNKRVNILTSVWVLVVKRDEKGVIQRFKARLAVRGFLQKFGIDYLTTYSPVVRIESVRLVMILALMQGLDCRHVDFVTAFLNGELADVDIYMEQPQGYDDGSDRVCHLLKGLYGLKQASKIWNDTLHAYLVELQFVQCVFDAGVYYRNGTHSLIYLTVYVDDIVIAAKPADIEIVVRELSARFEVKDLGRVKHLLGMEVNFQPGVILCLSQTAYVERLATRFQL
ncbi:hypothetical protein PF007_g10650 [Phytophthora fragariae]|nr:hypothetical protein PF003_g30493 [Phytophthora fragariae]KAE8938372.1 hypothetical protein PF009_g11747 [Phytophthora fragariae]KAE9113677.1 hypothetical protein PF007_g10650 [Phytophthora fragariae]KAE9145262.1 hypothetical protein PF006_g9873 [Phytophthora fragariae]KAE9311085.1 hypothetical protein PF001_g9894 [Phytophthora fragariae]